MEFNRWDMSYCLENIHTRQNQKWNSDILVPSSRGVVVYWIHLEHIYDIAFKKGMSIKEATQKAIHNQEDFEKVDVTVYVRKLES